MNGAPAPDALARDLCASWQAFLAGDDAHGPWEGVDAPRFANAVDQLVDAADAADPDRRRAGIAALFGGVVEPLGDTFAPRARQCYARVMARAIMRCAARDPALAQALAAHDIGDEHQLLDRYSRVCVGADSAIRAAPRRIVVLSRVTLGADILLTTVVLQRLHQRWPAAELVVMGDAKLAGLIGGLPGVRLMPLAYARRGPLRERLGAWLQLRSTLAALAPDLLVNPDSRLDQLGLLPLLDAARTLLWPTLIAGPPASLSALLDDWCRRRFGLGPPESVPRLAFDAATAATVCRLRAALGPAAWVAVKFDHGGNPAKALPRAAEVAILHALRRHGWRVLLDRGFGDEERASSDALVAAAGWRVCDLDGSGRGLGRDPSELAPGALAGEEAVRLHGSIALWAAAVCACGLAVSYDSVGHHLAAALGVPVLVAFTGHPHPVFPIAWQPRGSAPVRLVTIDPERRNQPASWRSVLEAIPPARFSTDGRPPPGW